MALSAAEKKQRVAAAALEFVREGMILGVGTGSTVNALIEQLGMKADRVAVELNRSIVPRDRWAATALHAGDQLEIVHFVGGG